MLRKKITRHSVENKIIFLHCDFNVNLNYAEKMKISYATIKFLIMHCKKLVIGTHYKRPSKNYAEEFSIEPLRKLLEEDLRIKIKRIFPGDELIEKVNMVENLRFFDLKTEYFEDNFDLIVFDAFSAIHRDWPDFHCSNILVGYGFEKEYEMALKIKKIDCIILGGVKEDKLELLDEFTGKIILCGKIADYAHKHKNNANILICTSEKNDIKDENFSKIEKFTENCNSIFWNGPPGQFENSESEKGTIKLLNLMKKLEEKKYVCVGGNDTLTAMHKYKFNFTHKSFSGGALLKFICNKKIENLNKLL